MRSWIIISEDKKFEVLNVNGEASFKYTLPNGIDRGKNIWSNMGHYKIRICVSFEDYDWFRQLEKDKVKDIQFALKNNDKYSLGQFDIDTILGISGFKHGRIIQLSVSNLEINKAPLDFVRNLQLKELLA